MAAGWYACWALVRGPRRYFIAAAALKWGAGRYSMLPRRCCRVSRKRPFSHSNAAFGSKTWREVPTWRLFGGRRQSGGFNPSPGRIWFRILRFGVKDALRRSRKGWGWDVVSWSSRLDKWACGQYGRMHGPVFGGLAAAQRNARIRAGASLSE